MAHMTASSLLETIGARTETDFMGARKIPAAAYWGIQTLRAVENFSITGTTISVYPLLIRALAQIKHAAVLANFELGLIDQTKKDAIQQACENIEQGQLLDQFVVDVIQGGAGTSTNMNANEVIANRALEILGLDRGEYSTIHPNGDVNMGQSTNDVYPTAIRIATIQGTQSLLSAMAHLRRALERKAAEFDDVVKMGRTQLQDAVPMTLGQEFSTYAVMVDEDERRIREGLVHLHEINLGATAIGTGINTHREYAANVCAHLRRITGLPLVTSSNLVEATQDCGAFVLFSGMLKRVAVKLSKVCNDLRLLASGPRAGFAEINLPPRQAGSSIMPGKVNPVIPEVVNQVAFDVIGNDLTITMAAEAGQLQLNAFEPIIARSLFASLTSLTSACTSLADLCIDGITANKEYLRTQVEASIGVVTVLNPLIGYDAATTIARQALASGRSVTSLVLESGLLTAHELDEVLRPERLANPQSDSGERALA
ncbi:aspartate ammonia-lyase [Hoyosella subflava]|uniref:Aspartate ammonia-lyase n=1 Tax=Hoyosella subflava (strain DSM 45089 / JCM 17490 / NBRC 109087 / DQS3-9A1) TaxID=443218 RepID=F6EKX1_HOYSD|nr:aspartate ammonia-lyase [Hoyosella subflava]AEF41451.1 Aspartate ammonia-lyase [Hoyosella subflava DQS3-9A1]